MILAGIATTLSTLFSYRALKLGKASYVNSLERMSLVFAVILSVLFLKEKITWQLVTGMVLMVGGALFIAFGSEGEG